MTLSASLLQSKVREAEKINEQMAEEKQKYVNLLEEERTHSLQNDSRVTFHLVLRN